MQKHENTIDVKTIDVKEQINKYFKSYALYVLQSRGIPNFYDSITPVQRLILMNAPDRFGKTIGLVGECIKAGYHHGDMSLGKAINKLARPFGCAEQLLIGDGFFGTPVNPKPSSARYTSVRISPDIRAIVEANAALNKQNADGAYEWISLEFPIGMLSHTVGIAVGYSSNILPRKRSDVEDYLNGKRKTAPKPYFNGFGGRVVKHKDMRTGWVLEGEVTFDDKSMVAHVGDLPPLMRYDSFIKRLYDKLDELSGEYKVENNSSIAVNIDVRWRDRDTWQAACAAIDKATKMIVVENFVFVRDGNVVEYDSITDYLDEFGVHRQRVRYNKMNYDLTVTCDELEFLRAKAAFMRFMMVKKRRDDEIREWMKPYKQQIRSRLDSIKLTSLSEEVLKKTDVVIKETEDLIVRMKESVREQLELCRELEKTSKSAGRVSSTKSKSDPLFEEETPFSVDGIEVYAPDEDEIELGQDDRDDDAVETEE